jgi:thioredoxin-like negative regulator of GroEL
MTDGTSDPALMAADLSTETTASDRGKDGKFAPGNPGRPKGAKHEALKLLDQIGTDNAEAVMRKVCEKAMAGDMKAAELVLRRLWPERKGRPVQFDLGALATAQDCVEASATVLREVAAGHLSPEEGGALAALLEAHREATVVKDLEARLARMEGKP